MKKNLAMYINGQLASEISWIFAWLVHFLFGDLLSSHLEVKFRVVIICTLLLSKLFYSVSCASIMLRSSLNKMVCAN
jgi:hypothetical protein